MIDSADTSPGRGSNYFGRSRADRGQFLPPETRAKEKFTRQEVLDSFNSGYQRFEAEVKKILSKSNLSPHYIELWKNGEDIAEGLSDKQIKDVQKTIDSLSPEDKKRLSDFHLLTNGKRLTIDQGKDKYKRQFGKFTSNEGVPVEGLLDFLHTEIRGIQKKAKDGHRELTDDEKSQISALFKEGHILYRSSRLAPRNLRFVKPEEMVKGTKTYARAEAEASDISKDPLRKNKRDRKKSEFGEGVLTMQNRRELSLPQIQNEPPIDVPPEPTQPPVNENGIPTGTILNEGDQDFEQEEPQDFSQLRREFYIVNRSVDLRKRAAEIAEAQLREEMRRGKWYSPKDFFRRVKLRIAEEFYRQKYKERALKAMLESNNSYLDFDCVKDAIRDAERNREGQKKAGESMIGQLKTGELIAGQQVREAQGVLKTAIIEEVIKPIIDGRITDEKQIRVNLKLFIETHQNDPDVQAVFGHDASRYRVLADFFATDLMEMGNKVKEDVQNHRYALEQIDEHTSIKLANSSWGAETEAHFNMVDRAVAWAQDKPLKGAILNPASIGAITSLAYSAITLAGRSGVSRSMNLVAPGLGSLIGGGFAAVRRWHDLNVDIASHRAEMAYGYETPQGARRREAIERLNYNTASVRELLLGGGQEVTSGANREGIDQLLQTDLSVEANRMKIIERIAEISQRLDLSVSEHIDLITAQGSRDILLQLGASTEQEGLDIGRMELVKQIVKMKLALRQAGMTDNDLSGKINQSKSNWQRLLLQNKEQQDQAVKSYKLKQAAGAGVFGGVVGMASYFGVQEGLALGERAIGMNVGETSLEHVIDKLGDLASGRPHIETPTVGLLTEIYNNGGNVDLSNDLEMHVDQATHQISILDNTTGQFRTDIPTLNLDSEGHIDMAGQLPSDIQNTFNQLDFDIDSDGGLPILDVNAPTRVDLSTGYQTYVPDGTEWVSDNSKWDLVLTADHSKILVDNAGFNTDGTISGYDAATSLINDPSKIDFGQVTQSTVERIVGGAPTHEDMTTGFKTVIPDGSHWVNDQDKWDLVLDSDPSKILVDNAGFNPDGTISGYDSATSLINDPSLIDNGGIEQQGGEGVWEEAVNYRVVHAHAETTIPLRNETFIHDDQIGVRYTFPEHTIINPNTGATESLLQAAQDNRAGLYLEIPGFGHNGEDVGIFIPAHFDNSLQRYIVDFDPTDKTTMIDLPDGSQISMGDFSQKFLNQELLSEYVRSHHGPGILDSETWYGGRQFFNLANPDGDITHQGRIHGGYFDLESKLYGHVAPPGQTMGAFISIHTDHGSGTVDMVGGFKPPTIDGLPTTEVVPTLRPPQILPIDIKGPELIPPIEAPPGIPLPWAPRWPLEDVEKWANINLPPIPERRYYGYGGYGSFNSLEEEQKWLKANPQAHHPYIKKKQSDGTEVWVDESGNKIERKVDREKEQIKLYLESLKQNDKPHYEFIKRLKDQLPPMSSRVRVSVNIPAWMEGKYLYNLLAQYTNQVDTNGRPLDPALYEINIIVNRKTGEAPDNSVAEIERFKAEMARQGKTFQIHYIDVQFDPPFNNVGNARRVITDLTLLRSSQRLNQEGQLYIETEDADLVSVDKKTVFNVINKLDSNPHLDSIRGQQDRDPSQMVKNDYLFLYRRCADFREVLVRSMKYRPQVNPKYNYLWNRMITGGWNTAYTAEAYALIGGYNPYMTKGEDLMIGEKITMARGDGNLPNTDVIEGVRTRSSSSPRRFIYEIITGKGAYGETFEDPAVNARIRGSTIDQMLEEPAIKQYKRIIPGVNTNQFELMLNNNFEMVRITTPNEEEARKVMTRTLLFLGFKPEGTDFKFTPESKLIITNWSNVIQSLEDYRTRHATT